MLHRVAPFVGLHTPTLHDLDDPTRGTPTPQEETAGGSRPSPVVLGHPVELLDSPFVGEQAAEPPPPLLDGDHAPGAGFRAKPWAIAPAALLAQTEDESIDVLNDTPRTWRRCSTATTCSAATTC